MIYLFSTKDDKKNGPNHHFYYNNHIYTCQPGTNTYYKWLWYDDVSCVNIDNEIIDIPEFDISSLLPKRKIFIVIFNEITFFEKLQYYINKIIFEQLL